MGNSGEAGVPDFVRLMKAYLEGLINVDDYKQLYFVLTKKRITTDEEASRILQQAYGDADDYDSEIRLPYTIEEPELRERVRRSLGQLAALGYDRESEKQT
jgi:hypothetical protein